MIERAGKTAGVERVERVERGRVERGRVEETGRGEVIERDEVMKELEGIAGTEEPDYP